MATIFDVSKAPWRGEMVPASFRGCRFFVEANSKEGGRRIVEHEFPKREYPYAEDLGRKAQEFTVRGYFITYPVPSSQIMPFAFDYRIPRDALIAALDTGQPGLLQLPTQAPLWVVCPRYRLTEEERFGGYCVVDMTFMEYGNSPVDQPQTRQNVLDTASALIAQALQELAGS
jgi:prophage DNA circulation protein